MVLGILQESAEFGVGDVGGFYGVSRDLLVFGDQDFVSGLELGEEGEDSSEGIVFPGVIGRVAEEDGLTRRFAGVECMEA